MGDHKLKLKQRFRYQIIAVGLATVALGLTGTTVAVAQTAKSKAVKPDFSFYVGKTLTLITGGAAGASNDEAALIVAPLMASYLHCAINVIDMPAGATVPAADAIAASAPTGLTFGQMGPLGYVLNQDIGDNSINFPLRTQEWIGGFSAPLYVVAATPGSGVKTFTQYLRADGGGLKLLELSGGGQLNIQVFDSLFNQHAQIVTGYTNGTTLQTGFIRGDGNASILNAPEIAPFIASGQFVGLALTQPYVKGMPNYAVMSKFPLIPKYFVQHPPKTKADKNAIKLLNLYNSAGNQDFVAPAGTPANLVAALAAAYRSAVHQPGAQAAFINAGIPNGYKTGPQIATVLAQMIKVGPQIAPYLG
jgi:tripartite-type tricarboxylate transporter receptor subunit TctC